MLNEAVHIFINVLHRVKPISVWCPKFNLCLHTTP